ncbi:MAG: hypothetical protein QXW71_01035 [Thermoplasmata archaeon]
MEEKIDEKYIIQYDIYVNIIVKHWDDILAFGKYHFTVDYKTFQEILNDPMRDYLKFGVKEIIYVDLTAFPIYLYQNMEIKDYNNPIKIKKKNKNFNDYKNKAKEYIKTFDFIDYTDIYY